jgi:hypothetical protein
MAKTILAALAGLILAGPAGAAPVGFVAAVRGMAEMRTAGSDSFTLATVDREVSEGDTLRTGRHAWAKVLLTDDTTIALDEETELLFDKLVVGGGKEPSRFELLSGHLRTKVAETFGDPTRVEVYTPTAVIGVKGTEWLTWINDQVTWVCVISGLVSAANRDSAVSGELDLGPGACARIARGSAPERSPAPSHLDAVVMRPGQVQDRPTFPASLNPDRDPLLIDVNDTRPQVDLPEPDPPPVRQVDDRPRPRGNSGGNPPPITAIP